MKVSWKRPQSAPQDAPTEPALHQEQPDEAPEMNGMFNSSELEIAPSPDPLDSLLTSVFAWGMPPWL